MVELDLSMRLRSLAEYRPVFHSEADFQRELAWLLRLSDRNREVQMEDPIFGAGKGAVDICVRDRGTIVAAIELKYYTQNFYTKLGGEEFRLKRHGAHDQRGYDVYKDIQRLERFMKHHPHATAAVILLTNDDRYWKGFVRQGTIGAEFALHEGRIVRGNLN